LFKIIKKILWGWLLVAFICQCGYAADFHMPFIHQNKQIETTDDFTPELTNTKKEKTKRHFFKKKQKEAEDDFWKDFYDDAVNDANSEKKPPVLTHQI